MKVLWLCNTILPAVAHRLGLEGSNKEGWVSGMAGAVLADWAGNGIELSVAFPLPPGAYPQGEEILSGTVEVETAVLSYYGFREDVNHPEKYDRNLEPILEKIVCMSEPDMVHCFGTEYPHTLAMCRVFPRKNRLLLGLQGLCTRIAEAYYADLPGRVIGSVTLRDLLKRDSLKRQREKFALRGDMEREAVRIAGNITGRTQWDRENVTAWNPKARYFEMNETLRPEFYGPVWREEACMPHAIFLSQGDYPLKGLHYMLLALPLILEAYPDARVYVAGNSLVEFGTWKQKLKISAYGRYLRSLLKKGNLGERVTFLGKLDAGQMRDRYLESGLFVCCSSLENSPNSLGEAMLLGMPCVSADVGGVASIFTKDVDGILYRGDMEPGECPGHRAAGAGSGAGSGRAATEQRGGGTGRDGAARHPQGGTEGPETMAGRLAEAVIQMWDNPDRMKVYCQNARGHALATHDRERNYRRLVEIYEKIL